MEYAGLPVRELIGVYHADGGLRGELAYLAGKLRGTAHCALCDITHSPVRRKREWDALVGRLGVPFRLYHLNERPDDVLAFAGRTPVVLARTPAGLHELLDADALEACHASVGDFGRALAGALARAEQAPA